MAFKINPKTKKKIMEAVKKPHSVLLAGPKGSGMHSTALILAKAFLKTDTLDGHPDFLEIGTEEGKEITKDQIIEACDIAELMPMRADYKVFVIDNAEQMNKNAQNALLKTLESNLRAIFIIVAHASLLPTIECRLENIPFLPVAYDDSVAPAAYFAAKGTPGAYLEIAQDEEFVKLLESLPAMLTNRKDLLTALHCRQMREKSFFETETPRKVEFLMNFIKEGLNQAYLSKTAGLSCNELFKPLLAESEERLEQLLSLTEKEQVERKSRIYGKNDFFLYLINLTKKEVA